MSVIRHDHIVPEGVSNIRFSDYVRQIFKTIIPSGKGIKKAIKRGDFLVDGEIATTGIWVKPGQKIELFLRDIKPGKIFKLQMNVSYEDPYLAVIHKPAGFVVSGNKFMTIENALLHNLSLSSEPDALQMPRPVHRLDRSTSGLLIVAKTAGAAMNMGQQFENRKVMKRYRAVVTGKVPESGRVRTPLENREADSEFRLVTCSESVKYGWLSRVDLFPHTGRTHQLRIHMAEIGHPVVGDKLYGEEGMIIKRQGLFLCAVEIRFQHPITKKPVVIEISEPPKFERYMLREFSRMRTMH